MGLSPDARLAARLLAADPAGLGGLWVRGEAGVDADALIAALREAGLMVRPMPLSIDEDRLTGGIDLAASLASGRPVHHAGLIEEARGDALLVRGAERMSEALTGRLAQARDAGGPALILIDEGREGEGAPAALVDRVAFHLLWDAPAPDPLPDGEAIGDEALCGAIAGLAATLGVGSSRAELFALRAARVHAERGAVTAGDVAIAARLVLAPRATRMPAEAPPEQEDEADGPAPSDSESQAIEDLVLDAIRTMLPPGLLDAVAALRARSRAGGARGTGARTRSLMRGRPVGSRAGVPRGGVRLALVDTLRAAAPWQGVRGRGDGPVALRKQDLRVRRHEDRETALTIFAVDASGSAAFARLAEAKGAVELLLERAYASRAEVALVAFRGAGAELLLPPTRSLTRARRLLGELPGGGATPLAAGLDAARLLAEAARPRGRTPQIVLLTDGRGNVAADGRQDRAAGVVDALAAARRIAALGLPAVVIDIGARPRPEAATLAEAMGAKLVHMPRADAAAMRAAAA